MKVFDIQRSNELLRSLFCQPAPYRASRRHISSCRAKPRPSISRAEPLAACLPRTFNISMVALPVWPTWPCLCLQTLARHLVRHTRALVVYKRRIQKERCRSECALIERMVATRWQHTLEDRVVVVSILGQSYAVTPGARGTGSCACNGHSRCHFTSRYIIRPNEHAHRLSLRTC